MDWELRGCQWWDNSPDRHTVKATLVSTHHMMRPVKTVAQVTQQESGLLLSSSSSLWQQHRQVR